MFKFDCIAYSFLKYVLSVLKWSNNTSDLKDVFKWTGITKIKTLNLINIYTKFEEYPTILLVVLLNKQTGQLNSQNSSQNTQNKNSFHSVNFH